MSIQSINSAIASIDREIHNIENQIQSIGITINRKEKEANSILDRISREKDFKRIINYQRDLARKNDEINRYYRDKTSKNKSLSDKRNRRTKLTLDLNREEQKERDKTKKEQKEILSLQHSITREMEKQKSLVANSIQQVSHPTSPNKQYDVFISHASEDKSSFVRPFVESLRAKGIKVWYDEFELQVGDSLRRSIDYGLKNSTYGIVVLSEAFFSKEWTQRELDGLFAREIHGEKVILPLWHKISKNEVLSYSPLIADMLAINTTDFTIEEIADKIAKRINK